MDGSLVCSALAGRLDVGTATVAAVEVTGVGAGCVAIAGVASGGDAIVGAVGLFVDDIVGEVVDDDEVSRTLGDFLKSIGSTVPIIS